MRIGGPPTRVTPPDYTSNTSADVAKPATGDPRFHALLKRIGDLHDMKQADYGSEGDPFANVRASEAFGVPAWVGTVIRANDKMKRLQTFAKAKTLKNESVEDSLMDLAVYALIALILFEEEK
jgi:hypothetical protein